jgi:hypothetical protein
MKSLMKSGVSTSLRRLFALSNHCAEHPPKVLPNSGTLHCAFLLLASNQQRTCVAHAKISFTFSRTCLLRDGFKYRIVLSMSE